MVDKPVPRNCAEYKTTGELTHAGPHLIDPDGPSYGVNPFHVMCNVTSGKLLLLIKILNVVNNFFYTSGATIVNHNKLGGEEITNCPDADCFNSMYTYESLTLPKIRALIQTSESCRQLIKVKLVTFSDNQRSYLSFNTVRLLPVQADQHWELDRS